MNDEWDKESLLRCPKCGNLSVISKEEPSGYRIFKCTECTWILEDE